MPSPSPHPRRAVNPVLGAEDRRDRGDGEGMTACRLYLTLCGLSLAFGCLIGLVVANRLLLAADGLYAAPRKACDPGHSEMRWFLASAPDYWPAYPLGVN